MTRESVMSPNAADEVVLGVQSKMAHPIPPVLERTIAWISRFRRLARTFERYARTVATFIRLAMIRIMLRRLRALRSGAQFH